MSSNVKGYRYFTFLRGHSPIAAFPHHPHLAFPSLLLEARHGRTSPDEKHDRFLRLLSLQMSRTRRANLLPRNRGSYCLRTDLIVVRFRTVRKVSTAFGRASLFLISSFFASDSANALPAIIVQAGARITRDGKKERGGGMWVEKVNGSLARYFTFL